MRGRPTVTKIHPLGDNVDAKDVNHMVVVNQTWDIRNRNTIAPYFEDIMPCN